MADKVKSGKKYYLKQLIILTKNYRMKEVSPDSAVILWFVWLLYRHVRLLEVSSAMVGSIWKNLYLHIGWGSGELENML